MALPLAFAFAALPDQAVKVAKPVKNFLRWNNINLKNPNWNILAAENSILQVPLQLPQVRFAPGLIEVLELWSW